MTPKLISYLLALPVLWMGSINTSHAQSRPSGIGDLGFPPQTVKDTELLDANPYFQHRKILEACVSQVMAMSLDHDEGAVRSAFGLCSGQKQEVIASLASRIGAPRARAAVSAYIDYFCSIVAQKAVAIAAANKKASVNGPFWSEGLWTVKSITGKGCGAYQLSGGKNADGQPDIKIMVMPGNQGYDIRFIIGDQSPSTDFSRLIGKLVRLKSVIIPGGYGPSTSQNFNIEYRVLTNDYDVFLVTPLAQPAFSRLTDETSLQITTVTLQRFAPIQLEVQYALGDLPSVLQHIDKCNASNHR